MSRPSSLLDIYDAAVNPDRWPAALTACCRDIDARSSTLMLVDLTQPMPWRLDYCGGALLDIDPASIDYYARHYAHFEHSAWERLQHLSARQITRDSELINDIHALTDREDFVYLRETLGIFRRAAARLNDNRRWVDAVAFQFAADVPEIPAHALQGIQTLLPHVAKSFELARTYRELKQRYAAVLGCLDRLRIGVCVVERGGTVVVRNSECERLLDLTDAVFIDSSNRLRCRDGDRDAMLRTRLGEACLTARGNGRSAESILLLDKRDKRDALDDKDGDDAAASLLLEVAPLRDGNGEIDAHFAGAIVFIVDPDNVNRLDVERLAAAYGLSLAESEVCKLLAEGLSTRKIADQRNTGFETAKSQVGTVLQKTGSAHRVDLVRLAMKTSPPVD